MASGKHSASMKQRHHLAVRWGKVPEEMTLNSFAKQYEDARNSDMWGMVVLYLFLSTSLVMGKAHIA